MCYTCNMPVHRGKAAFCAASLLALAVLAAAAGCTKTAGGETGATAAAVPDPAQIAAGKAAYEKSGCARCHGTPGGAAGRAPDLSHAGADASHDAAWMTAFVKDPKAQKPGARMPGFAGKMSDADLTALGVYLASLK